MGFKFWLPAFAFIRGSVTSKLAISIKNRLATFSFRMFLELKSENLGNRWKKQGSGQDIPNL